METLHIVHGLGAGLGHGGVFALLLHHLFHLTAESVHPGLQVRLLGSRQASMAAFTRSNSHGSPSAARAIMTPSQPVCCIISTASSAVWMSPLPSTGTFTAALTLAMMSVDARGIHLLPGAGVDGDEFSPRLLAGFGALHRRDVVGVPAFRILTVTGRVVWA